MNKNDNIYSESSNNFYYDDSGDGGYTACPFGKGIRPLAGNHLEIRCLRRAFNDFDNGIVNGQKK